MCMRDVGMCDVGMCDVGMRGVCMGGVCMRGVGMWACMILCMCDVCVEGSRELDGTARVLVAAPIVIWLVVDLILVLAVDPIVDLMMDLVVGLIVGLTADLIMDRSLTGMQVNAGKGGTFLFPFLCSLYDLEPSRTAMVGDRLDTDVAMGKQGGLRTILPLTGVTSREDLEGADPQHAPDHVITSFAALAGL